MHIRVRACIHLTHFCYDILVYTIKMPYQYRFKLVYLLNGSEHGNSFGRTCGETLYFDNCVQTQRLPGANTETTW